MQNLGFRRAISGTEDSGQIGDCQLVRLLEQLTNESETCNAVSYIVPEYQTYFYSNSLVDSHFVTTETPIQWYSNEAVLLWKHLATPVVMHHH